MSIVQFYSCYLFEWASWSRNSSPPLYSCQCTLFFFSTLLIRICWLLVKDLFSFLVCDESWASEGIRTGLWQVYSLSFDAVHCMFFFFLLSTSRVRRSLPQASSSCWTSTVPSSPFWEDLIWTGLLMPFCLKTLYSSCSILSNWNLACSSFILWSSWVQLCTTNYCMPHSSLL